VNNVVKVCAGRAIAVIAHNARTANARDLTIRFVGALLCERQGLALFLIAINYIALEASPALRAHLDDIAC
jgi:hypothetical protein